MQLSYQQLRRRSMEVGLWPEGRISRIACYTLALAGGLFLLQSLFDLLKVAWGQSLGGWVAFLAFIAAILFSILAFRWLKVRILWRLRNRLIVTYVFIGVIPVVLLVALASITIYLFAGQFASFVVTSEIKSQLRSVEAVDAAISNELAARVERGERPTAESLAGLKRRDQAWGRRQVCAWYGAEPLPLCGELPGAPAFDFPAQKIGEDAGGGFQEIVRDRGQLYLRVASVLPIGPEKLTVVASEPLDQHLVGKIADNLGEITVYASGLTENAPQKPANSSDGKKAGEATTLGVPAQKNGNRITIRRGANGVEVESDDQPLPPTFVVGSLAPPTNSLDREITFPTVFSVMDWKTGERERAGAVVQVLTRPSVLYGHLFGALGEFAKAVEDVIIGIAIFFAIIELAALFTGWRMTRTVTGAVADLHGATQHVDRGDFSHRIPLKSSDQLADLALSFNSMTESIEKLILEQKEKQRLENELVIAQEVQSQLFPRQVSNLESLEVHGFCRPARTVSGDYYDFLTASSHKLILAVGDISGKGISAALLMATIHSAVRAYSMESMPQMREPVAVGAVSAPGRVLAAWPEGVDVSPGVLLGLLNHQLYESTPPEKYATLFLGVYDGRSHRLTYSNGGHLPPLLISKYGTLRRLERGGTVIGLFDNMRYEEGQVEMHPEEIFVAYSDGVTEPENDFGEFGEERLIDLVRDNRRLPLEQISQLVTTAVDDWIGDNEQPDDVTLVLARAR
jgi:phosphoserine phosphatase RsbU/P